MKHKNPVLALKLARQARGLTLKEVASALGLKSLQTIHNWERGLCPPKSHIPKYAKVLGMSEDVLWKLVERRMAGLNNDVSVTVNINE